MPSLEFAFKVKSVEGEKIHGALELRGNDFSNKPYTFEIPFDLPSSKAIEFNLYGATVHIGIRISDIKDGHGSGDYDGHINFAGGQVAQIPKQTFKF